MGNQCRQRQKIHRLSALIMLAVCRWSFSNYFGNAVFKKIKHVEHNVLRYSNVCNFCSTLQSLS